MDMQYDKRIRRTQRSSKSGNTNQLTQNNTKNKSNWKTPGHDGIHGFWFKKFTPIQDTSTRNDQMHTISTRICVDNQRKEHIQKNLRKRTAQNIYRPINCLQMMWKILTAKIGEEIYNLLTSFRLLSKEQKGCHKQSRGKGNILYIDQHILNKRKTRRKNLAMTWIDYKKVYVPKSWIINCLKMYEISDEVINFIEKTMKTWKVELIAWGRSLAEMKVQRGIFQGDARSRLLFIIAIMPLNYILRKCKAVYKLSKSQEKINHLMYIKLFA